MTTELGMLGCNQVKVFLLFLAAEPEAALFEALLPVATLGCRGSCGSSGQDTVCRPA